MGIVASALEAAWHVADRTAPHDVAHTAAKAHGIGADEAFAAAFVGELHAVALAAALLEVEGAEIDPRALPHLLVDQELRGLPLVIDGVVGIVDAAVDLGIADVDGVGARLRNGGLIGDGAGGGLRRCCLSRRTCPEGVVALVERVRMEGES